MVRIIILVIIMCATLSVFSQKIEGKAIYKTHRKIDVKLDSKKAGGNSEIQKIINEQLKKQFQKTFVLNFTSEESTYKQKEKLSKPEFSTGSVRVEIVGNGSVNDILYKNLRENRYLNKTEISGKLFLIKDELADLKWEMTGETKTIGKYTCYKAVREQEIESVSFKSSEEGKNKEERRKEIKETVAWYTPEIPISNGPGMHGGLPGLILEIQEGKQTIVCSEIVINSLKKIEIKEPTKGKKVSQEKFDKIMREKNEEMMERFKNRRKSKDGSSFSIEIQG